jgi:thiamine biosynthesis lipoprotein
MVEIGGEVRTKGMKPDGTAWRIGIETPTPFSRGIQNTLALSGQALATSGDYRNFVVIEGKRYSHTINPRTGWPVDHQLASASVIAETCMLADAYATSLMVLGPEAGYDWATEHNVAAMLILRDGDQFLEKNRCITGSCGGLAGLKDEHGRTQCEACTNPAPECQTAKQPDSRPANATDADPT